MDIKDIFAGGFFLYEGDVVKISKSSSDGIKAVPESDPDWEILIDPDDLEGIPITPQFLQRFGFLRCYDCDTCPLAEDERCSKDVVKRYNRKNLFIWNNWDYDVWVVFTETEKNKEYRHTVYWRTWNPDPTKLEVKEDNSSCYLHELQIIAYSYGFLLDPGYLSLIYYMISDDKQRTTP